MAMTPEEIAEKEFLVSLRGYDKNEVRSFLQIVADAFRTASAPAEQSAPAATEAAAPETSTEEPAPTAEPATAEPATAEPATEEPAPAAGHEPPPSPGPASTAGGADWANLGEEIAAVLRTAHEQGERHRAQAEGEAAATRRDAEAWAEAARAAAEQDRTEAASRLASAQDEALVLVADAQDRADKMMEATKVRAREQAEAAVAHLTGQIEELTMTRDRSRSELSDLRARLDTAIDDAGVPPPAVTTEPDLA